MPDPTDNTVNTNEQRRLAVRLRLEGRTISAITEQAGLSAPTIIAAHKAYLAGGWQAVDAKARGRQPGEGKLPAKLQVMLAAELRAALPESTAPDARLWSHRLANTWLENHGHRLSSRAAANYFQRWDFDANSELDALRQSSSATDQQWLERDYQPALRQARQDSATVVWAGVRSEGEHNFFFAHTLRKRLYWLTTPAPLTANHCTDFLRRLQQELGGRILVVMKGIELARANSIVQWLEQHTDTITLLTPPAPARHIHFNYPDKARNTDMHAQMNAPSIEQDNAEPMHQDSQTGSATLTHLQRLEAESIHIMREVVAEADNPVMLYSVGKDSAVMLHLALKAFYPAKLPFPLLHVDTTWKFRAMYEFRDRTARELGIDMLTYTNPDGLAQGVNPFSHGSGIHTDIMKTDALKQALDKHGFDVAFGGARRDEEKSRAKERIFSFRTEQHRWEPKNQRPELWNQYNTCKHSGESIRVFPLSNWTELDIWQYIHHENIPIVPLYLAADRPVVERDGALIMVDDERMPLHEGEVPMLRKIRFRTLGCYPLSGAIESSATTIPELIRETLLTRTSERQGRLIDHDKAASMEKKKQEGYF